MLAVLLVSACFTGTLLVRAAQDVAIDESHFPDAGFRQIVAEKCDKNGDGILSDSERSSITRMMLPAWQEDVLGKVPPLSAWRAYSISIICKISIAQTLG